MEVPGQSNLKGNSHSRSSHSKKVSANSEESTNQGLTVRISQLSRERSRNLQYRNGVNMKSYQQMIGCAKLWFAFASSGLGSISLWFESLNHPAEERFGIRFQNKDVCIRYEKYLAHVCKLCKSADGERLEFQTFVALRHHMSNVHQLTYCHICTDNLMLFSRLERKTYTRDALQRHIRCGDKEDKSMKGHPSCLFCEQRFFDEECRYRHLRKEHFFCQFCENEGRHFNIFFGEHSGRRGAVALDFQYNGRQLAGSSRPKRDVPDAQNAPVIRRDKISVIQQEQVSQPRRRPNEYIVVPSAQSNNRAIRSNASPLYTLHSEDFPSLGNSLNSVTSLRPDDFPQLNRVNRANPHGNSSASTQSTVRDSSSRGFPSSSNISKNGCESAVEDFPALSVSRDLGSVTSAWSSKKSFKSIISPNEVPSNTRTLPQPDIWPLNISTPSTTDVETEQWQESKPYTGSMFSNLSLSNLFDVEPFKKDEVPSLHCSATASDRGPQSQEVAVIAQNVDTPPGVYIGPSSTSDILLGPPPGFENVCIVDSAPPGLSASPSPFRKTTLISQSDTKNTSIEAIQKAEDECYDSNEN
uniref:C2H2-type domain-containing protein n=1 Tax=Angiostrongylus cantonensis TaxID=6313 RepID=A0A0K0DH60_ANGCA